MSWKTDCVGMLRVMCDDTDPNNYTYSDDRMLQILVVSAKLLLQQADFTTVYTISFDTLEVTPDFTISPNIDQPFENLLLLRAACLIDTGETRQAAKRGFSFKDDTQAYDGRGVAAARAEIMKSGGWCKQYETALEDYQNGLIGEVGAAIISPFRTSGYTLGVGPFTTPFR